MMGPPEDIPDEKRDVPAAAPPPEAKPAGAAPPPAAIPVAPPPAPPADRQGYNEYDVVSDTVGMVPSRNRADRVFQAVFILVGMVVCAAVGLIIGLVTDAWPAGLILGVVGGLILSTLISGLILMVKGWVRASRMGRR